MHVKFIAVQGAGDVQQIERYFYGETQLIESAESGGKVFALLRTEAPTEQAAQSDAEYVKDKLISGLYAAKVYDEPKGLLPIGADDEVWFLNR